VDRRRTRAQVFDGNDLVSFLGLPPSLNTIGGDYPNHGRPLAPEFRLLAYAS
jgi:hypothetical protein